MTKFSLAGYVWICIGYALASVILAFIVPIDHWTFFAMVVVVAPMAEEIIKSIPFRRDFAGYPSSFKYAIIFPTMELIALKFPVYLIDITAVFYALTAFLFHMVTLLVYISGVMKAISLRLLVASMMIAHSAYNYCYF
jgi:hypothetical protein